MKIFILLAILLNPLYSPADNNLLSQNLDNSLWNMLLLQNSDTISTVGLKTTNNNSSKYIDEGLGGIVVGALGGLLGSGIGMLLGGDREDAIMFSLYGLSAGVVLGIPTGVRAAGNSIGDKGNYWKSFLVTILSSLATAGLYHYVVNEESPPVVVGAIFTIPVIGAVWGYHLQ